MNKAHFIGELRVAADYITEPRLTYVLLEPFGFYSARYDRIIFAPKGFTTDFGSVPRLLEWSVSGEDSQLAPGSVIHDYIYRCNSLITGVPLTRLDADRILIESMEVLGANWYKRNKVFVAVRTGGAFTWKSK